MLRLAFLLLIALPLVAAPRPRETVEADKLRKIYGWPQDADRDCDFAFTAGRLKVHTPKAAHALGGHATWGNAPRTVREVEGDFTITLNISVPLPPGHSNPLQAPRLAGGLVVFGTAPTGPRRAIIGWVRRPDADGWNSTVEMATSRNEEQGGDSIIGEEGLSDRDWQPLSIAFTRIKDTFQTDYRVGDGKWKPLVAGPSALPEKLTIGVFVENTTGLPAVITFEDFLVEAPMAKE
jgi:hypothetical protein